CVVQVRRVAPIRSGKGRAGEDPLPETYPVVIRRHRFVVREPDPALLRQPAGSLTAMLHEIELERADRGADAGVFQQRLESTELDGGELEDLPRHSDEHDTTRRSRSPRAPPRPSRGHAR